MERSDEHHGLQSAVDLSGGGIGVPERLGELSVDPVDLGIDFVTATGQFSSYRTKRV